MGEFEEHVTISASAEKVWDALADIGNIYVWNPGVVHSEQTTTGDVGMGVCRRCNVGGKNYLLEEVVEFERPSKLTMRITETNLPFKSADIRFWLESKGDETRGNGVPDLSTQVRPAWAIPGLGDGSVGVSQRHAGFMAWVKGTCRRKSFVNRTNPA